MLPLELHPPPLSRAQLGELRTARAQAARVGATAGRAGVAEAAEAAEEAAEAAAEEEELLRRCSRPRCCCPLRRETSVYVRLKCHPLSASHPPSACVITVARMLRTMLPRLGRLTLSRGLATYPSHTVLGLPALSPTMTSGNIAKYLVKVGDEIQPGDRIAEIETDKATVDFDVVDGGCARSLQLTPACALGGPVPFTPLCSSRAP